jgi:Mrp family chromosome partitioning ATPase
VPAVGGEPRPAFSTETVLTISAEAFRSLRTSLGLHQRRRTSTRIIAVTSSQPLEGKTTTACNLALALAFGGSRVLLIDADMRRPGLHKTSVFTTRPGSRTCWSGRREFARWFSARASQISW